MKKRIFFLISIPIFLLTLILLKNIFDKNEVKTDGLALLQSTEKQSEVKIAILDSGINKDHKDLVGLVVNQYNVVSPGKPVQDDFGHGTAIAGIIASQYNKSETVGIPHKLKIFDVKVLDEKGYGTIEILKKGLHWAIDHNVDIINISFGFKRSDNELQNILAQAYQKGIVVVAASGNNYGLSVEYPAKYNHVISVGAVDENLKKAKFSATGKIDFVAPGVNIESTSKTGSYDKYTGTSFSAAFVTGNIATIISDIDKRGSHKIDSAYQRLQEISRQEPTKFNKSFYGNGIIQGKYMRKDEKT